jgi:hypothetical protein
MTEVANYTSSSSNLIDTGWVAAYLGIAVAAFSARTETVKVKAPAAELARPSLLSLVSPLLTVMLALTVAAVEIRLGHHLDRAGWLMAFGLIAVVLTRQGLAVLELLSPPAGTRGNLLARLADSAQGGSRAPELLDPGYRSTLP